MTDAEFHIYCRILEDAGFSPLSFSGKENSWYRANDDLQQLRLEEIVVRFCDGKWRWEIMALDGDGRNGTSEDCSEAGLRKVLADVAASLRNLAENRKASSCALEWFADKVDRNTVKGVSEEERKLLEKAKFYQPDERHREWKFSGMGDVRAVEAALVGKSVRGKWSWCIDSALVVLRSDGEEDTLELALQGFFNGLDELAGMMEKEAAYLHGCASYSRRMLWPDCEPKKDAGGKAKPDKPVSKADEALLESLEFRKPCASLEYWVFSPADALDCVDATELYQGAGGYWEWRIKAGDYWLSGSLCRELKDALLEFLGGLDMIADRTEKEASDMHSDAEEEMKEEAVTLREAVYNARRRLLDKEDS